MTPQEDKTLHLGLCMAGAVSAGAYIAGVMDYLLEALNRWEDAKKEYDTVPDHQLKIDVITGASAGGMTAALTAVALQKPFESVTHSDTENKQKPEQNILYNSWINLTGEKNMMTALLDSSDITLSDEGVVSLFNSSFIEDISNKLLVATGKSKIPEYVAEDLDLWLSLSNLSGLPNKIRFNPITEDVIGEKKIKKEKSSPIDYISHNHRDFLRFTFQSSYERDDKVPIDFSDQNDKGLRLLKEAAIATGAFPIGLAARKLKRDTVFLLNNKLMEEMNGFRYKAEDFETNPTYSSIFVDGGLLNNEPFDAAKKIIQEKLGSKEETSDHNSFTRTLIMIDPFPSKNFEPENAGEWSRNIGNVLAKIISTLRDQAALKVEDIKQAINEANYEQFLIVPLKEMEDVAGEMQVWVGEEAIACGGLEGFSGFFAKEYRIHDFLLGRKNCQTFIRNFFKVPVETKNPIFEKGYSAKAKEAFVFKKIENDGTEGKWLPIIPDVNPKTGRPYKQGEYEEPNCKWPFNAYRKSENNPEFLKPQIKKRIWQLGKTLVKSNVKNRMLSTWLLTHLWFGRDSLTNMVYRSFISGLQQHRLYPKNETRVR